MDTILLLFEGAFTSQPRMKVRLKAVKPILREPSKNTREKVKKLVSIFTRQVCFKRFNFPPGWQWNWTVPFTYATKVCQSWYDSMRYVTTTSLTILVPVLARLVASPEEGIGGWPKKGCHGSYVMRIIQVFGLIINAENAFLLKKVPGLRFKLVLLR